MLIYLVTCKDEPVTIYRSEVVPRTGETISVEGMAMYLVLTVDHAVIPHPLGTDIQHSHLTAVVERIPVT